MTKIKIEQINNGFIVKRFAYNEIEMKEIWETFVFERPFNNGLHTKEDIVKFQELLFFIENTFSYDCVNDGEYYIEFKLRKK